MNTMKGNHSCRIKLLFSNAFKPIWQKYMFFTDQKCIYKCASEMSNNDLCVLQVCGQDWWSSHCSVYGSRNIAKHKIQICNVNKKMTLNVDICSKQHTLASFTHSRSLIIALHDTENIFNLFMCYLPLFHYLLTNVVYFYHHIVVFYSLVTPKQNTMCDSKAVN